MTAALALQSDLDRYVGEISKTPLLNREQEFRLARRYRDQGDLTAAHELVVANLRFVVKVAHQYKGYGLKLLDLVQEGNIGLMHAVKKFDPERGYRLISYAVWWIRAQIQSYILKSWSLVKLGSGRVRRKLFFKLRSERSRMLQASNGAQDNAKLAEALGVTEAEIDEMGVRLAARDFSLDAPIGDDADSSHLEQLPESSQSPESDLLAGEERKLLAQAIESVRDDLNEKERYILDGRLLNDDPRTLAEIGEHFGVSRERIRQLESRVLSKLRAAPQLRSLALDVRPA